MEEIPNEILFEVLSYLTLDERQTNRRVNKNWKDLISDLPIHLSKQQKKEALEDMKKLAIQIYFVKDIIDFNFEEETKKYLFLDSNQNRLFELTIDPYEEGEFHLENKSLDKKKYQDLKTGLNEIFEMDDIVLIVRYIEYMNFILKKLPEIKFISSDEKTIDIKDIDDIITHEELAFLQDRKDLLIKKNPIFEDIFTESYLKSYLDELKVLKRKILNIFPNYVVNDKDLLERYILSIFK